MVLLFSLFVFNRSLVSLFSFELIGGINEDFNSIMFCSSSFPTIGFFTKEFNCLNPNGYNNDEGGNKGKFCKESKRLLSEKKSGENNPFYGKKHLEETRKKMSEAHKGKCVGENHPMYGKHQSEETKEKNRQAHLKENLSEETRIKMSTKAKQRTGLKNHRSKPVWCEELKEVRPSGKEWAKELKLVQSSVSQCCNGKRNHTGGYHFRFATKEEIEKYKKRKR